MNWSFKCDSLSAFKRFYILGKFRFYSILGVTICNNYHDLKAISKANNSHFWSHFLFGKNLIFVDGNSEGVYLKTCTEKNVTVTRY